jgi:uncharacterized protein YciI
VGYVVLEYALVEDYLDRRGEFRAEHLALARAAHDRGEIALAGALADPADRALLVFTGDDPGPAERFAAGDPYVRHGLVSGWTVRPWNVVVGD